MATGNPNLKNIRTLLTKGFSEAELRRFFQDEQEFSPILPELADKASKADIITHLFNYAEQRLLFEPLLAWAKESNPSRYEKHKPYCDEVIDSPIPKEVEPQKDERRLSQKEAPYHRIGVEYEEHALISDSPEDWLKASEYYWDNRLFAQSARILIKQAHKLLSSGYCQQTFELLLKFNQNQLLEEDGLWQKLLETRAQFAFQLGKYDVARKDYNLLYDLTDDLKWLLEIGRVYNRAGEYDDACRVLDDARVQIVQTKNSYLQARVYTEMGRAYSGLDKNQEAIDWLKEGLNIFHLELTTLEKLTSWREAEGVLKISKIPKDYREEAAWALRYTGLAYQSRNQLAAIACWAASQLLWTSLGDVLNAAAMQTNLSAIYFDYSINLPRANYWFKKAEKTLKNRNVDYDWARFYNNGAYLYYRWGKFKKALMTSKKVFNNLNKNEGFVIQLAEVLDVRAAIYTAVGKFPNAENDYKEAIQLSKEVSDNKGEVKSGSNLGLSYLAWGCTLDEEGAPIKAQEKYNQAEKQFMRSLSLIEKEKLEIDPIDIVEIQSGLAESLLRTKRPEDARKQIEQAISALSEDAPFFIKGRIFRVMGELLWYESRLIEAQEQLLTSWHILSDDPESTGIDKEEIWVLKDLVGIYSQMEQTAKALGFNQKLLERQQVYQLKVE